MLKVHILNYGYKDIRALQDKTADKETFRHHLLKRKDGINKLFLSLLSTEANHPWKRLSL